ncbi:MAG: Hpt domain-containing protein [Schleiferiaceae bacterium]|nr:Hpt domain-containing protein [Schleiferiaceae bacterium]MDR9441484.1 Hpt domain-containing protein [Schleiferiaceae bacterium]
MGNTTYDLSTLEELAGGDEDFIKGMVDAFLEHIPQQFKELKRAKEEGKLRAMGEIAHKIKPNLDLFGLPHLGDVIREVEQMGKNEVDDPAIEEKITFLDGALKETFLELKARQKL